jgi:molybdopterin-guanine dinucleotide biosynthesis protein A
VKETVIGAVLAGGRGRRMGGDKALLELGGQTLAQRAVDALRETGLEVALVLRAEQPAPSVTDTVAVVRDKVADAGPLGGIHALLGWLPKEWALVAPCDQPFLASKLLRGLLDQRRDDVDAVVAQPNDLMEPLPGLYRRTLMSTIEEALARGQGSLQDLLASVQVRTVRAETLRQWDPELRSFANVNTPQELARAADALHGER